MSLFLNYECCFYVMLYFFMLIVFIVFYLIIVYDILFDMFKWLYGFIINGDLSLLFIFLWWCIYLYEGVVIGKNRVYKYFLIIYVFKGYYF